MPGAAPPVPPAQKRAIRGAVAWLREADLGERCEGVTECTGCAGLLRWYGERVR